MNSKLSKKSIILLSGGLDSAAVLGLCKEEYNISLALTFNYGQKTAIKEIEASQKLCKHYDVEHKIINLDWLKEITQTALVSQEEIATSNLGTADSAKNVWVPNRNGLFLNIAAAFADSYNYNYILFGANKDEGRTFPDNTEDFRKRMTSVFEFSTLNHPIVVAPLLNYNKDDIVRMSIERSIPLEYIHSCYSSTSGIHCGKCESCLHLKRALMHNNAESYLLKLFGEL